MTEHASTSSDALVPVTARPFNAEAPLSALAAPITPTALYFVRSNFDVPQISADGYRLQIGGAVQRPQVLALRALAELPQHELCVTFECAGNGRKYMRPLPEGVSWNLGAVSTGSFGGVRLREVLAAAGVRAEATEILFVGADGGEISPGRAIRFERSIPLERALHADTLLALRMNGAPLTPAHGFPLRLVVPGWYGVASVKWLVEIRALEQAFAGHFQAEKYVYIGEAGTPDYAPVREMRVRSVIATPADGARLPLARPVEIAGSAWSGCGPIAAVDVSVDGGASWRPAQLDPPASAYAATPWRIEWRPAAAGRCVLMSRARDAAGKVQPRTPPWNRLGYGNNAIHAVEVLVE